MVQHPSSSSVCLPFAISSYIFKLSYSLLSLFIAGEILAQALPQLERNIHPVTIISAFKRALKDALEIIEEISLPVDVDDDKAMYQLISSSVVAAPPNNYILKLLNSHRPLYVPANGHRSNSQPTDTKEDMMEIFQTDVTGQSREYRKLMGRRNYAAVVAYDPEAVSAAYGQQTNGTGPGAGKLNLAVDFMVQGEGLYPTVAKYGPVIVPSLGPEK